jgi:hypothetical protein
MSRNRRERGEGQFGCLVGLVLLLIAGLVAYKLIPVKVKSAEMRDAVVDEAKSAGRHQNERMSEIISKNLLEKAKQLGLPVKPEDVKVERTQSSYVRIEVKYSVPVQFPGFTYNWNFRHYYENPIF